MKRLKQIVFTKLNTAEFLDMGEIDFSSIKENEVAVKSYLTTVSAGREKQRAKQQRTKTFFI